MRVNTVESPRTIFQEASVVQGRAIASQTTSTLSSAGQGAPRKASIGSTICGVIAGCCVCALGCLVAIFHCVTCGIFLPRKNPALEKSQNDLEKALKDFEARKPGWDAKAKELEASGRKSRARMDAAFALNNEETEKMQKIFADWKAEGTTPAAQEKMKKRMDELKAEMAAKRKEIFGEASSQPQAASKQ